jgi:hypothetical protein
LGGAVGEVGARTGRSRRSRSIWPPSLPLAEADRERERERKREGRKERESAVAASRGRATSRVEIAARRAATVLEVGTESL